MNDKIPAGEISEKSGFLRWMSNFWYHNKIITIVILFVIFVVVISAFQMCSRDIGDVTIIYGGPAILGDSQFESIRSVFNAVMPEDFNRDGRKYTELINYTIMNEEQIKEYKERLRLAEEERNNGGGAVGVDQSYFTKQYETYRSLLLTGEYSIYLVDPWLFDELVRADRLQRVADILPGGGDPSFSEYGVRLGDTAIYREYAALRELPDDTVVCLLKPYIVGASSREENYAVSKAMFSIIAAGD